MAKKLLITEKPSVAMEFAKALKINTTRKNGYLESDEWVITWCVGHLVTMSYPEKYDENLKKWRLDTLPFIPKEWKYEIIPQVENQFNIIKTLMSREDVEEIYNAGDSGREGEYIQRLVFMMAKPRPDINMKRVWIDSQTEEEIIKGIKEAKELSYYDSLADSAYLRAKEDYLIGINFSRLLSIIFGRRVAKQINEERVSISVGRVMTCVLGMIVSREREIRNFKKTKYYKINGEFGDESFFKAECKATEKSKVFESPILYNETGFKKEDDAKKFIESIKDKEAIIDNVKKSKTKENAPLLFNLAEIQNECTKRFKIKPDETLEIIQELYEKKLVTYPRTDSRYLTSDIKPTFPKILESLKKGALKPFVEKALVSEKDLYGRFINNKEVTDHHAIIPTGVAKDMDSWPNAEKIIFDLIARRFIGMFLSDRVTVQQNAIIQVDRSDFTCTGEKLIEAGWSEVDKNIGNMKSNLPELHTGDSVAISKMWVRTDETTPPAPHTEASLLLAMEHAGSYTGEEDDDDVEMEFGIGTPATRAQTIEKLIEKEMAVHKGKALIPTEYGIKLVSILPDVLRSPELTGKWEAKLTQIAKGKESPDEFMADIKNLTTEVVDFSITQGKTNLEEAKYVGKCPVCGNWVKEFPTAYYCITPGCDFKKIFKAVKGFHPTLDSLTMHELLANGTAETGKGVFSIIEEPPFIAFKKAPDTIPDYKFLKELIEYYGLHYVNNVCKGGALWIAGDQDDELMQDFVKECKAAGCIFIFKSDSKALKGKPGWYLSVKPEHKNTFCMYFH